MVKRRVTSIEVAREAGVSRTTVSLVLNNIPDTGIPEETRRKVLETAARLNYHPNVSGRRLVSGRTHTLALVLHQSSERAASDHFLLQVLRGLDAVTRANDYYVLLRTVDPTQAQDGYGHLIYAGYADGIILSGPLLEEPEAVELYQNRLPIVVTGRLPGQRVPWVDADNYQGAQQATNHLIRLGHRRIGLITNAPRYYLASQQRFLGYHDSLLSAGLPFDESLVVEACFTSESGLAAMNTLLDLTRRPTAVFVASDVVAFGAMHAIRRRGWAIPQDVAIVGFDDVAMSRYVEPFLTTVRLPAYDLGWEVGQLCLQLINQEEPAALEVLLPTELVIRASCGGEAGNGNRE
ncbi:MAG: LacI family DNA-binding transcriptional regulator [Chloroflexota bacterium]